MSLSMYQASVPVFVHFLSALSGVLDKAQAHAANRKLDPAVVLGTRLFPDMFPLSQQVTSATDHALRVACGLSGVAQPTLPDAGTSFEQAKARVDKAVEFLKGLKAAQIDGTEAKEVTLQLGGQPRAFKGQSLLLDFAIPNFYFHMTTAYGILRHCGVDIGKRDFMGMKPAA